VVKRKKKTQTMQILWRYSIKNPLTISNCGSSCAKTLGPLIPCSLGSSLISVFSFLFLPKKKKSLKEG